VYTEDEVHFFMNAFKPVDKVTRIVRRLRRSFLGRPYIALHVQMDHFKTHWRERYVSPEDITELLKARSDQLQLADTPVYLATGNPEAALVNLTKGLPGARFVYRKMVSGDLEPDDYIVQAAIDQEMCLYSKAFISTTLSSFGTNTFFGRAAVYGARPTPTCLSTAPPTRTPATPPRTAETRACGAKRGWREWARWRTGRDRDQEPRRTPIRWSSRYPSSTVTKPRTRSWSACSWGSGRRMKARSALRLGLAEKHRQPRLRRTEAKSALLSLAVKRCQLRLHGIHTAAAVVIHV